MSYLVLARKWRPQAFEDVIGQGHVTRTLQNAIRRDKLAHALLFSGPRGVGKTSVARILAKAINCEDGPTVTPCNRCGICTEITSGASMDVQEIDGASNRGIDEIRQLRENIKFRSTRCRFRVYIIDEVHMLTKEAFNALLKTLEEPPPHVYFIFATTEPQRIPATIQSRCQHYEFRRLSVTELADHLERVARAEGMALDRQAVTVLAREARGGVRDSLSLLDQVAAYGASSAVEVCEALGVVGTGALRELALSTLRGELHHALRTLDELYRQGTDIQVLALDLSRFVRDLVVLKLVGPEEAATLVDLSPEEVRELWKEIREASSHNLRMALEMLLRGQESVQKSSTPRLAMETLLIRVASACEVVGLDRLLGKINELLEASPAEGKDPPAASSKEQGTSASSPASRPGAPAGRVELDRWSEFVGFAAGQRPALAAALKSCRCRLEQGRLHLECGSGMNYDVLSDQVNIQRIEALLKEFFGAEAQVVVTARKARDPEQANGLEELHAARKGLLEEPLVQEAIRVFHARVMDVRPEKGEGRCTRTSRR